MDRGQLELVRTQLVAMKERLEKDILGEMPKTSYKALPNFIDQEDRLRRIEVRIVEIDRLLKGE